MRLEDLPEHLRVQAERQLKRPSAAVRIAGINRGASLPALFKPSATDDDGKGSRPKAKRKASPRKVVCNAELKKAVVNGTDITFLIAVNPHDLPTAQQKGVDFKRKTFYTKPKVKAWERKLTEIFSSRSDAAKGRTTAVLYRTFGVEVLINFAFPFPESAPKKDRFEGAPMLKRPDCDNLAKGVIDALTDGGIIPDDNLVGRLKINKFYTLKEPYILVSVSVCPSHEHDAREVERISDGL